MHGHYDAKPSNRTLLLLALLIAGSAIASSTTAHAIHSSVDWDKLVDEFFAEYFDFHPSLGTYAGLHQYDSNLEDYSRQGIEKEAAFANHYIECLENFRPDLLSSGQQQDRRFVISQLKARLLQLQAVRSWEKNPDDYSSGITQSAFGIISRKFAPPQQRLRSLIEREKKMPAVFAAARANLKNPPHIYTEVAIQQLPGLVTFFQNDVPAAFSEVKDPRLLAEFHQSNAGVIAALQGYETFLKDVLLPASNGDFRLGAENYQKKLLYDEMVDIPLDRLLQIGYDDLHRNQEWLKKVATQIGPSKTPNQILEELRRDHPAPDQLLQTFRDVLGGMRQFLVDRHIVTIPSSTLPTVEESPPFERALTFASMSIPGPYEKVADIAFFNVTTPETGSTKAEKDSYMGQFNRNTIIGIAMHEVYPGHYVQFLWRPAAPSKIRKLLACKSNAEGWAHYGEQIMLDEGYENGDPKLRLGQVRDALLRDARFIVGISLHTGNMTFEQAVEFFQKEGHQSQSVAEMEARRGTLDPTYLVYTLGKLEILKLREDYKKKMGSAFSLQQFHDTFLKQGSPPIKIVRETMLDDSSPVL
jgi:uncharacterized protein (DUF885 family)